MSSKESVAIGLRVQRERRKRDWTQAELVERLAGVGVQVSTMTISRVEKGRAATFELVRGLSTVFRITPEDMATPESEAKEKEREDAESALADTLEELLVAWRDVYELSDQLAALGTTESPKDLVDRLVRHYFGLPIELNQRTHPFIREGFRNVARELVHRGMTDRARLAREYAEAKQRGDTARMQQLAARRTEADAFESTSFDDDDGSRVPAYDPRVHRGR